MSVKNLAKAVVGTAILLGVANAVPGQEVDTKQFYKKPETAAEFWRVMKHEIELGQFKLANDYLRGFIAKNPTDEELLALQEREGNSTFLRLLLIPEMAKDARPLVDRVGRLVEKHLTDPARLKRLVSDLGAAAKDPRETEFLIEQLRRSGAAAVPALIQALTSTNENSVEHAAVLSALEKLDQRTTLPIAAALDIKDPVLRSELIDVFRRRADFAAVPFLWYFSAAPDQPPLVRSKALETISALLGKPVSQLPRAIDALTREAEKFHQHKVPLAESGGSATVWKLAGNQLASQTLPLSQAEEFYSLFFAGEALKLNPAYEPAQVVFLSAALDKAVERAGIDQPLSKTGLTKELLTSVNPDLVANVLRKALDENRIPVALAATRALGEMADLRAALQKGQEVPALLRALSYPDRRVQAAAAEAILHLPHTTAPIAGSRVVEVLRRLAGIEGFPRALVVDKNQEKAMLVAKGLQAAGYQPVLASSGTGALKRLRQWADIDAIVLDADVIEPMLVYLLPQLHADIDFGRLPILVTAPPARVADLSRRLAQEKNLAVTTETTDPESLKRALGRLIESSSVKPLSSQERKDLAALAMEWLARMARGEVHGYDARSAEDAIRNGLNSKDLAGLAIPAFPYLLNPAAQGELARFVLDESQPAQLRSAAAAALARSIQRQGLHLAAIQITGLQNLYASSSDAKLRGNLAAVLGSSRPDARQTGQRLQQYVPPAPEAAPAKAPPDAKGDAGGEGN